MATVGVDLGGTKLLAGAVAGDGEVLFRSYRRIAGLDRAALLLAIEAAVIQATAAVGGSTAVGVGLPAVIDPSSGIVTTCNHHPLEGLDVRRELAFGMPVSIDNDANCAAYAEWRLGAAAGTRHAVLLTLGTGIGGGLIVDGALYRGASGGGAELGHMVVDQDGPACFGACPGRGCLESLASGSAIARDAAAAGLDGDGEEVTRLALAGDEVARGVLDFAGQRLGAGLAGLAMIFDPEVMVVGGGVMRAGDLLLQPARRELARRAMAPASSVPVRAAALGEDAGMIGAALLAAEEAT